MRYVTCSACGVSHPDRPCPTGVEALSAVDVTLAADARSRVVLAMTTLPLPQLQALAVVAEAMGIR